MKIFYSPSSGQIYVQAEGQLVIIDADRERGVCIAGNCGHDIEEQLGSGRVYEVNIFDLKSRLDAIGKTGRGKGVLLRELSPHFRIDPNDIAKMDPQVSKFLMFVEEDLSSDVDGSGIVVRIGGKVLHVGTVFDRLPHLFVENPPEIEAEIPVNLGPDPFQGEPRNEPCLECFGTGLALDLSGDKCPVCCGRGGLHE